MNKIKRISRENYDINLIVKNEGRMPCFVGHDHGPILLITAGIVPGIVGFKPQASGQLFGCNCGQLGHGWDCSNPDPTGWFILLLVSSGWHQHFSFMSN